MHAKQMKTWCKDKNMLLVHKHTNHHACHCTAVQDCALQQAKQKVSKICFITTSVSPQFTVPGRDSPGYAQVDAAHCDSAGILFLVLLSQILLSGLVACCCCLQVISMHIIVYRCISDGSIATLM